MQMRVLLAEDDMETADFVREQLVQAGYDVICVTDGEEALQRSLDGAFDLLILDRMLPRLDGLTVLRRARLAGVDGPAIMLTALGDIADRVEGLDAGADDYLVKPFAFSELQARINAMLRRRAQDKSETVLRVGSIALDLLSRTLTRDAKPIVLQPREFKLLEMLARNAGRIVTRSMLLELVWGFHFDPQTRIVETHMSRMRTKLNAGFEVDPIETVRGEGYRMRQDV